MPKRIGRVTRYTPDSPAVTTRRLEAQRHADAQTLLGDLLHCRSTEQALALIDRALLLAWIAGGNAQTIALTRKKKRHARG